MSYVCCCCDRFLTIAFGRGGDSSNSGVGRGADASTPLPAPPPFTRVDEVERDVAPCVVMVVGGIDSVAPP